MSKLGKIRCIALGLIRHNDRLLVGEGYDPVKSQAFYRALGGGIDFGETSLEALKREFFEEIQAELTNIRYRGCLENIFTYNGQPGHEFIQVYECDFAEPEFYQRSSWFVADSKDSYKALWVEIRRFQSGELRLVPENFLEYL